MNSYVKFTCFVPKHNNNMYICICILYICIYRGRKPHQLVLEHFHIRTPLRLGAAEGEAAADAVEPASANRLQIRRQI